MRIESKNGKHIIENENGDTITLSDDEIAALVQGAHRILDQIESAIPQETGFQALATMPIQDVVLGLDAHKTVVILQLLSEDGTKRAFTINPQLTEKFRDSLTRKIEQIKIANQSRQAQ